MKSLISLIAQGKSFNPKKVIGYSNEELDKIEKLYNIKIIGNFRLFMVKMGRCIGGLLSDEPFIFYKKWSIHSHLLTQIGFKDELLDIVLDKYASFSRQYCNGVFLISIESETQYYYLNTKSKFPERIFHFDENTDTIKDTGKEFIDYVIWVVERYRKYGEYYSGLICQGELLIIE